MSNPNDDDPAEPAPLVALLESAGVTKTSVIRVTGPRSLAALLWLCRHGYDRVGCMRAGQGSPHEADPDALLVAHTCGDLELKLLLPVAREVRPGGVFIFRLRTGSGSSRVGLEWLLKRFGLVVERRIENERRAIVVARRNAVALQQAA
jgi:hypothetical protein